MTLITLNIKRPMGAKKAKMLKKEQQKQKHLRKIANKGKAMNNDIDGYYDSDDEKYDNAISTSDNNDNLARISLANENIAKTFRKQVKHNNLLSIAKVFVTMGKQSEADVILKQLLKNNDEITIENVDEDLLSSSDESVGDGKIIANTSTNNDALIIVANTSTNDATTNIIGSTNDHENENDGKKIDNETESTSDDDALFLAKDVYEEAFY